MRGIWLLTAMVLAVIGTEAVAAGPLDGVWTARMMPEGACPLGGELTLNLADTQIAGAVEDPNGTFPVQGLLNATIGSVRMGNALGLARF
ncbi:MAG TPA: hypothetical protein VEU06_09505, partial [Micropepsaceae bacterium]|nr:hypothetical protein [Micropepsaceae bacterium]